MMLTSVLFNWLPCHHRTLSGTIKLSPRLSYVNAPGPNFLWADEESHLDPGLRRGDMLKSVHHFHLRVECTT